MLMSLQSPDNLQRLSYILVSVCKLLPIAVLHRLLSSRSRETQGGENSAITPAMCHNHMRIQISVSAIGSFTHSSSGNRKSEGIRNTVSGRTTTAGAAEFRAVRGPESQRGEAASRPGGRGNTGR